MAKKVSDKQLKAIRRNYAIKASQDKKVKPVNSPGNNTTDNLVMRLARIPNKYLFDSSKPQDLHTYAVYKDDETKEVRAIETTHLYIPDKHNMNNLHKGLLRKVKFAGYETPSGVHNTYFNKDIEGNPKRGAYQKKVIKSVDYWGERHYKYVTAYSPNKAEDNYRLNMTAKGAPLKLGNDYDFVHYVEKRVVQDKLSPCAVLGEIKRGKMFRTDISKTTLYRYISQGIFMGIKMTDLPMYKKKKTYRKAVAKRPPKGISIEQRPLEIKCRENFGHWEMDCVIGKRYTKDTLLCFTERLTRYEIIMKMPNHKAATVVQYLNKLEKRFGKNFRKIFKSITVDNGVEFSDFKGLEKSIYKGRRTSVYYCHPYTSCERGSNERLNRDIRRLLPKGTDFTVVTDDHIQAVENWVNAYPRKIFGYATAAEMFAEQIALLTA